jgi:predicted HicB family RNase H-like nuclease
MKNVLEYKGYHTKVEFDVEDCLLRGKIEGIGDLVNFECENACDVETEFHNAVDDYLEFCQEVGKEPDKEYKGSFNIRISPDLHKKVAVLAMKNGDTLNATVEKAIAKYISEDQATENHLEITIKMPSENLKTESIFQYPLHNSKVNIPDSLAMRYAVGS